MNHAPAPNATPVADQIAALHTLLEQAQAAVTAQGRAYGTERDEDTAWRCAWNTWRTLSDLVPAVRALLDTTPTTPAPAAAAVRHLAIVPAQAA